MIIQIKANQICQTITKNYEENYNMEQLLMFNIFNKDMDKFKKFKLFLIIQIKNKT